MVSVLFAFLLLNTALIAQNALTPDDVAKIQNVTGAVLSPDGQHAAYTISVPADPNKENRRNRTELHVLDIDSGESRPYYSATPIGSVDFRPGHNTITFLTSREGDAARSLYELPLDGGEPTKLFTFDSNILTYEWANDGNHLAFTVHEQLPQPENNLPYQPDIFEEHIPNRHGFITNLQHNVQDPYRINVNGTIYMMQWGPDNSQLAVSVAPTPHVDDMYMSQQVFIIDYNTGNIEAEINNEGKIGQIEWSPDGNRLALRAGKDINDPIDGRILIVSARGGVPRIIDQDFEGKYEQIAWNENNRIHFLASEGVTRSFGSIQSNGSDKEYIVDASNLIIGSFQRSENNTTLFTANTMSHPNEVFVLTSRDNQPRRMTVTNPC